MARYYGVVGYSETIETSPGVWIEQITERPYYGDVIKNTKRSEESNINADIKVNNIISIVADPYAYEHFFSIRYISWMNVKWIVSTVEVLRPRLNLTLGGVYNEESSGTSDKT